MSDMGFEELQQVVSICLDEIVKLKEENASLRQELSSNSATIVSLYNAVKKISESTIESAKLADIKYKALLTGMDNLKYEIADDTYSESLFYPKINSIDNTIDEIVNSKKSMARFGDGEFAIMLGYIRHGFQNYDDNLARRLREIIAVDNTDFIVAIGDCFGRLDAYNQNSKQEIRAYMTQEQRSEILGFLHKERMYHNAYITRPYAMYKDNNTDGPQNRFNNLKRIWNNRNVVFVEGTETRLGVGNDLFNNTNEVKRILAPSKNAFSKYDDILEASLKYGIDDTLYLIALGPAAGVLAYDLYKNGRQAVDIGHLDLEYEWMLNGSGGRSEVKNKYNNEYPDGDVVAPVSDKSYFEEIVWNCNN